VPNFLGKHASDRLREEAPRKGEAVGSSRTISHWTRVLAGPGEVGRDGADAGQAARAKSGQIATLILPAGTAWGGELRVAATSALPPPLHRLRPDGDAAAARARRLPGAALLVDGAALRSDLGEAAACIAKATGARLMPPFSRDGSGVAALRCGLNGWPAGSRTIWRCWRR